MKASDVVFKTRTLLKGCAVIEIVDRIFVSGAVDVFVESNLTREFWR